MKIKMLALCVLLGASALAYADEAKMKEGTADKMKPGAAKLTDAEQKILSHNHHVNMMEIDAGQYAQKNASAAAVKEYAKTVVADHQRLDRDLVAFGKKNGVSKIAKMMPMSDEEKRMHEESMSSMAKMKKMKRAELDRAFLSMMVTNHETELGKLDSTIAEAQNADLKKMLEDTRPVLQRHVDKARELQKQAEQVGSIDEGDMSRDRDKSRDKNQNQPVAPTP
jgi:putative membrane protein